MANENKRHDMSTFGGRLAFFREKAGFTQQELAQEIFSTRQLVNAWERNKRFSYAEYLDKICHVLNVDESLLVNGVSEKNQVAATELGLSESSIEFLKGLKSCDYYYPFTETDSDELSATSIGDSFTFDGYRRAYDDKREGFFEVHDYLRTDIEGGYPDEMLHVINLLLSSNNGKQILAMIAKFVSIDFNESFVNGERVFDLSYNVNSSTRKETEIPTSLMKYAILQAISSKLEELRIEDEDGRK